MAWLMEEEEVEVEEEEEERVEVVMELEGAMDVVRDMVQVEVAMEGVVRLVNSSTRTIDGL